MIQVSLLKIRFRNNFQRIILFTHVSTTIGDKQVAPLSILFSRLEEGCLFSRLEEGRNIRERDAQSPHTCVTALFPTPWPSQELKLCSLPITELGASGANILASSSFRKERPASAAAAPPAELAEGRAGGPRARTRRPDRAACPRALTPSPEAPGTSGIAVGAPATQCNKPGVSCGERH